MLLENFLQLCIDTPEIVDVVAEEPSDNMMNQIISKDYNFTQKPTLFKFTLDDGVVNLIVPFEVWGGLNELPVNHLIDVLNRISDTTSKLSDKDNLIYDKDAIVYFLRPDTLRTYCLVGRSIDAMTDTTDELNTLITLVKTIPNVNDATPFNVVDTNVLSLANSNSAIYVVCDVTGSTEKTELLVPDYIYSNTELHIFVQDVIKTKVEDLTK
jgi:hypothetical protein